MGIFSKEEARKILEKAMSFSTADACVINLSGAIAVIYAMLVILYPHRDHSLIKAWP